MESYYIGEGVIHRRGSSTGGDRGDGKRKKEKRYTVRCCFWDMSQNYR